MSEQDETPRIGCPLPNAHDAVIDPRKLFGYALHGTHERGRHKANVFHLALSIGVGDLEHLRASILSELPHWPVTGVRLPRNELQRVTWEVFVPVRGLNAHAGRTLKVLTSWEMVDGRPVLKTTRVGTRKEQ